MTTTERLDLAARGLKVARVMISGVDLIAFQADELRQARTEIETAEKRVLALANIHKEEAA